MPVDPVGLGVAAIVPIALYGVGVSALAWCRAPFAVYDKYKTFYDQRNPNLAERFVSTAVTEATGVTLRLVTKSQQAELVDEVSCGLWLAENFLCETTSPLTPQQVSPAEPVELRYPDDFANPSWPLAPGTYEVHWKVTTTVIVEARPRTIWSFGGLSVVIPK